MVMASCRSRSTNGLQTFLIYFYICLDASSMFLNVSESFRYNDSLWMELDLMQNIFCFGESKNLSSFIKLNVRLSIVPDKWSSVCNEWGLVGTDLWQWQVTRLEVAMKEILLKILSCKVGLVTCVSVLNECGWVVSYGLLFFLICIFSSFWFQLLWVPTQEMREKSGWLD